MTNQKNQALLNEVNCLNTEKEELKRWIEQKVKIIEEDERYSLPEASAFSNVALLIIQTKLKTKIEIYQSILQKLYNADS